MIVTINRKEYQKVETGKTWNKCFKCDLWNELEDICSSVDCTTHHYVEIKEEVKEND